MWKVRLKSDVKAITLCSKSSISQAAARCVSCMDACVDGINIIPRVFQWHNLVLPLKSKASVALVLVLTDVAMVGPSGHV